MLGQLSLTSLLGR